MLTRGLQAGVGAGFSFSSQFRMALESGVVMGRRVGLIEDARKAKIDFYRQDFPKMTYFARISMDIYLQDNRNSPEDVLWELRN
jgi:hypothetical protein